MPDWQKLVRQRLGGLALDAAEKEEVHAELAAHLEETYEALLREGTPESDAIQRALSLANDWNDLQRKIHSARTRKDTMTNRVKQFWLPGLLTIVLSMVLLMLIEIIGPKPRIVAWNGKSGASLTAPVATFYVPWLLLLPLVGAIGAFLSHRAGGSQRAVFTSIVFPVLPYLACFLVGFPFALILDDHVAHNVMLSAFLVALVVWVLVPAAALLAGGLPAQLFLSRRSASRSITVG